MATSWKTASLCGALSALALVTAGDAFAKDKKKPKGLPTIEAKTEKLERSEGLFEFYENPKNGSALMEISEDQLGQEFIAFTYTENGVLEAGTFRGAYNDQRILRFERHYGKIEVYEVNTAFHFDQESAISRAADANISPALLGQLKILAKTKDEDGTRYLIDADDLFRSEMLSQITPAQSPFAGPFQFQVGGLNAAATKYDDLRAYPENVDVVVDYVFRNPMPNPLNPGSRAVTDARSVTLKIQHSLVSMPDEGFEPRLDDYRVGYFFDQVTDLTSFEAAPYRDLINRWRLVKKDPEAALSEPVKPITWWIENTTPLEYRDIIAEAVLAWNEAFEAAGFKNAIEVKVQPDDAEWDAGDIRYNVLRWTSSPNVPFGGYGPSFSNPRTGEILGADIMLELAFLRNNQLFLETFADAAMPAVQNEGVAVHAPHHKHRLCSIGKELQAKLGFSLSALEAQGASEADQKELMRQSLMTLILHEVGHTLGLNHNMKASSIYGPDEIHDKAVTNGAPSGSVMDYHAANIAPLGREQGDYEHTRPGPYDLWAIEFGYRPEASDPDLRAAILSRSTEPKLAFGNDADDMRSSFSGVDPRVMISDQSSDPVQYGIDRIELVRATIPSLLSRYDGEESYQKLLRQYLTLSGQQARMGTVMSKWIGGVLVERAAPGQADAKAPYTPVPEAQQKKAMHALAEHIFAADAFEIPDDLLRHLQRQRRGFNFFFDTEDPKLHARALGAQMGVIAQITSPVTMERITDSSLYGNGYSAAEVIQDLNDAVFGNDLMGAPNTFRRNLQVAYTRRLVGMAYGFGYDPVAQAAALAGVQDIKSRFGFLPEVLLPIETRAHRAAIRHELGWLD